MKKPLIEHRRALTQNQDAYTYEVENNSERLIRTLIPHIKGPAVSLSPRKHGAILARTIALLFETQDERPIFHVEGTELPLCWNRPLDWDKAYIKYEWGHLRSKNQNPLDEVGIADMALYSARCNQHIQAGMNIEELMIYGGLLAQRISNVLIKRRVLFASQEWQNTIAELR
jgi:hypothetical protein